MLVIGEKYIISTVGRLPLLGNFVCQTFKRVYAVYYVYLWLCITKSRETVWVWFLVYVLLDFPAVEDIDFIVAILILLNGGLGLFELY